MPAEDRLEIARDSYLAFAAGDRRFFEERLGEGFLFSSPPDPRLDRHGWFERCWPGAGDEVIVTYELHRPDGSAGCNTEVLTFDAQDRIVRTEVYFGWDLGSAGP